MGFDKSKFPNLKVADIDVKDISCDVQACGQILEDPVQVDFIQV